LQSTDSAYAPSRVDDSQVLVPDSKQFKALMCRHYLHHSLDSHVQCDSFDTLHDTLSSSFDDLTFDRFMTFFTYDHVDEPLSYQEALASRQSVRWLSAIQEELDAMEINQIWTLVPRDSLPPDCRIIDSTWVFRLKKNKDGSDRYRARLVGRGFKDPNTYDISEIYAPVVDVNDIRTLFSVGNKRKMFMRHIDITTAFLHGELEKTVYMSVPTGSNIDPSICKTHVYQLHKSLYGLKVSPKRWFEKFRATILKLGFKPYVHKPCIFQWRYTNNKGVSKQVTLALYVDDILFVGDCNDKINDVVNKLQAEFQVTDLGFPQKFLGIEIIQNSTRSQLFLHQASYTEKLIARFGNNSESTVSALTPIITLDAKRKRAAPLSSPAPDPTLYRAAIGSLIFLANGTRPDIAFAVNAVSRAQSSPSSSDWEAVVRIIQYLKGTLHHGLLYKGKNDLIECYIDASLGTNDPNARSTSGYVITTFGDVVSWRSKKQTHVSLSSAEAEYIAASFACRQVVSVKTLLHALYRCDIIPIIYEDNKTAILLAKSLEAKSLKHVVHLCFHYIRFEVLHNNVKLCWVPSHQQLADVFTKALPAPKFLEFQRKLVGQNSFQTPF
jgi:hypothetical protein